jgi:hypothetical protein
MASNWLLDLRGGGEHREITDGRSASHHGGDALALLLRMVNAVSEKNVEKGLVDWLPLLQPLLSLLLRALPLLKKFSGYGDKPKRHHRKEQHHKDRRRKHRH